MPSAPTLRPAELPGNKTDVPMPFNPHKFRLAFVSNSNVPSGHKASCISVVDRTRMVVGTTQGTILGLSMANNGRAAISWTTLYKGNAAINALRSRHDLVLAAFATSSSPNLILLDLKSKASNSSPSQLFAAQSTNLYHPSTSVSDIYFIGDEKFISVGQNGSLALWRVDKPTQPLSTLQVSSSPLLCCCVTHKGQFVLTGGEDSTIRVFHVEGDSIQQTRSLVDSDAILSLYSMYNNPRFCASVSRSGAVKVWDVENGM